MKPKFSDFLLEVLEENFGHFLETLNLIDLWIIIDPQILYQQMDTSVT